MRGTQFQNAPAQRRRRLTEAGGPIARRCARPSPTPLPPPAPAQQVAQGRRAHPAYHDPQGRPPRPRGASSLAGRQAGRQAAGHHDPQGRPPRPPSRQRRGALVQVHSPPAPARVPGASAAGGGRRVDRVLCARGRAAGAPRRGRRDGGRAGPNSCRRGAARGAPDVLNWDSRTRAACLLPRAPRPR